MKRELQPWNFEIYDWSKPFQDGNKIIENYLISPLKRYKLTSFSFFSNFRFKDSFFTFRRIVSGVTSGFTTQYELDQVIICFSAKATQIHQALFTLHLSSRLGALYISLKIFKCLGFQKDLTIQENRVPPVEEVHFRSKWCIVFESRIGRRGASWI